MSSYNDPKKRDPNAAESAIVEVKPKHKELEKMIAAIQVMGMLARTFYYCLVRKFVRFHWNYRWIVDIRD